MDHSSLSLLSVELQVAGRGREFIYVEKNNILELASKSHGELDMITTPYEYIYTLNYRSEAELSEAKKLWLSDYLPPFDNKDFINL